jgi:hypothetical protein
MGPGLLSRMAAAPVRGFEPERQARSYSRVDLFQH